MVNIPLTAQEVLLQDAAQRDVVTARRKHLIEILWSAGYLTRAGLISRVEAVMRKGCFGESAWSDTFYRDMRVVKKAFQAAGYDLAYSRSKNRAGYYLYGQDNLNPEMKHIIEGSVADVDTRQVAISRQLQPGERVQQGISITDLAHQVVAYRHSQREASDG